MNKPSTTFKFRSQVGSFEWRYVSIISVLRPRILLAYTAYQVMQGTGLELREGFESLAEANLINGLWKDRGSRIPNVFGISRPPYRASPPQVNLIDDGRYRVFLPNRGQCTWWAGKVGNFSDN